MNIRIETEWAVSLFPTAAIARLAHTVRPSAFAPMRTKVLHREKSGAAPRRTKLLLWEEMGVAPTQSHYWDHHLAC